MDTLADPSLVSLYLVRCWLSTYVPPRGFGALRNRYFIFKVPLFYTSISNYFQGEGEQALNFGELGSTVRISFFNLFLVSGCVCAVEGGFID